MLGQATTIIAMRIYFNMIQVDIYIFLSYTFSNGGELLFILKY